MGSVTLVATLTVDGWAWLYTARSARQPAVGTYVAEELAPTLRPGQVVWNNLIVHKSDHVRRRIDL